MKLNKILSLVVCLCVALLLTQSAWAQYKVNVTLSDMPGDSAVVTLGIHPGASYGVDGPLAFGPGDTVKEVDIPPPGPGNFDARLVSIPFRDSIVNGAMASIHKEIRVTQSDKWKITFQPEVNDSGIANPMTLSWPAGLGSVGGGYWRLQDEFGAELANMATSTSFMMPNSDPNPQSVFVVTGDSLGFLTAVSDSIALSVDSKGKAGKFEKFGKAKAYASEACFTLPVTDSADGLHLEFGQGLLEWQSFSEGAAPTITEVGKTSKFDKSFASRIYNPATVSFCVKGAKGKPIVLKKYWWTRTNLLKIPTAAKLIGPNPTYSRLLLHKPNWINVLEEIYLQLPGLAPNGLAVGEINAVAKTVKGKDIFRGVIHPKYSDVYKTLNAKGQLHAGVAHCLDLASGKPIVKIQKALPPSKHDNKLLAELLALKVNINSSVAGKTNTGFGGLYFDIMPNDLTTPAFYKGMTVNQIASFADSVISCDSTKTGVDPVQLYNVVLSINKAFNGPMDTTGFATKTKLKSPRVLATLNPPILYRPSAVAPPPIENPNWVREELAPEAFKLEQNYPNPFNPTTTIEFNIPADAFVTLKVYNMLGQEVATLLDHESMTEGADRVEFSANTLASGVYFYRIMAETVDENGKLTNDVFTQVKKMMLLK